MSHLFLPVSLSTNRPAIKSQQTEHTEEVRLANNSYSNYLIDNQIIANYLVDIYIRLLSHIVSLLFIENETLLHLALLCHALPSTKNVKNSDQNFQGYGKVQNICHQSEILQLDGDKMSVEQNIYYQPEILQLGGDKTSVEVPYGDSLVVKVVHTSHHQRSERYGSSRGIQCSCMALMAICWTFLKRIALCKTADLDCILQKGR